MRYLSDKTSSTEEIEVEEAGDVSYVIGIFGSKMWMNKEGDLHNFYGPAVIQTDGTKLYYVRGQLHRLDGPAIEHINGTKSYYLYGKQVSVGDIASLWGRRLTTTQV